MVAGLHIDRPVHDLKAERARDLVFYRLTEVIIFSFNLLFLLSLLLSLLPFLLRLLLLQLSFLFLFLPLLFEGFLLFLSLLSLDLLLLLLGSCEVDPKAQCFGGLDLAGW